jgi:glycine cleavage system protein P-like pyridoxal-binding family
MPIPVVGRCEGAATVYRWLTERDLPQSIGRLSAFMGNAGVLLRAYIYMRMLGRDGMSRVGEYATLNANYVLARLREGSASTIAYPNAPREPRVHRHDEAQARELASPRWTSPSGCSTTASTRRPPTSRCWCRSAC